jgi:hypothetical protein
MGPKDGAIGIRLRIQQDVGQDVIVGESRGIVAARID